MGKEGLEINELLNYLRKTKRRIPRTFSEGNFRIAVCIWSPRTVSVTPVLWSDVIACICCEFESVC